MSNSNLSICSIFVDRKLDDVFKTALDIVPDRRVWATEGRRPRTVSGAHGPHCWSCLCVEAICVETVQFFRRLAAFVRKVEVEVSFAMLSSLFVRQLPLA